MDKELLAGQLKKTMSSLDQRERQIIRWRFGLEDEQVRSLQECGESFGITRERVRQIERKAMEKLRAPKRLAKPSNLSIFPTLSKAVAYKGSAVAAL